MISNINSIWLYKKYYKSILLNIKFLNLQLYYIISLNRCNFTTYFLISMVNYKYMLKLLLGIINIFLLSINIKKLSFKSTATSFLPKKYSLTTVLKSPHIDKRSREQFHLIEYKSLVVYPLFFSISKNNLFNKLFLFDQNFNTISDITKFC